MPKSQSNSYYQKKLPKGAEKFKHLLPYDGFCTLKPDDFKEMMKIIHNEPDKAQKHVYFTKVLDKLFASGWGWYMRLGESLSAFPRYKYVSQLPEQKRADGLAVLRMVKSMHIELHYTPSYISMINQFIREYGGHTLTKEEVATQRKTKIVAATKALQEGRKLPRGLKKTVKKTVTTAKTR